MTTNEIFDQMNGVFRLVFDDNTIQLNTNTTAADIENWDSISHIELIVALEAHFNIQFQSTELEKLHNVGQLADAIQVKLSS